MAKKDFSTINTGRVSQAIEQATGKAGQQTTAPKEEQTRRMSELRTQGRKGCKAVRINMAFTPENHRGIKVLAKVNGETMTTITNWIIENYRLEHPELFAEAERFINMTKSTLKKYTDEEQGTSDA